MLTLSMLAWEVFVLLHAGRKEAQSVMAGCISECERKELQQQSRGICRGYCILCCIIAAAWQMSRGEVQSFAVEALE